MEVVNDPPLEAMLKIVTRKGLAAFVLALLFCSPALGKDAPQPPPVSVEDARARLAYLRKAADSVDAWVEMSWGKEFDKGNPGLSRDPKQLTGETEQAWKARQMAIRMAMSDIKARLRTERREWVSEELERVLSTEIAENFPVKLGPYDSDRKVFPLLLGFGWPSGISVILHVPEREHKLFAVKFPDKLPAKFRVNEQGEVSLVSIERRWDSDVHEIFVAPPGPRLSWESAHGSWVTAVAFRPDGGQVLSAGADGVIACRDADSGNPVFTLTKTEMAMSLAWSPDGAAFAAGGADAALRVRSAVDGKTIWKAEGKKGMVMSVAWSPDGRHVAAGDDMGMLKVYNAETGEEKFKAAVGMPVRSIDFTQGGKGVVVGGEGNMVLLWEMGSGRIAWRKRTDWPVYAVAGNPARAAVAAGGGGNKLLVLKDGDGTDAWEADSDGEVRAVRFDPTGRLLACGGAGYTAKVFLAMGGDPIWSAQIGSPVRALAFGAEGRKLFVGSADAGIRMFSIDEVSRVQAAFGPAGRIYVERTRVDKLFQ
jgi:outer membrane protein assembly factor BamB